MNNLYKQAEAYFESVGGKVISEGPREQTGMYHYLVKINGDNRSFRIDKEGVLIESKSVKGHRTLVTVKRFSAKKESRIEQLRAAIK